MNCYPELLLSFLRAFLRWVGRRKRITQKRLFQLPQLAVAMLKARRYLRQMLPQTAEVSPRLGQPYKDVLSILGHFR